jgi:hypothetical protein
VVWIGFIDHSFTITRNHNKSSANSSSLTAEDSLYSDSDLPPSCSTYIASRRTRMKHLHFLAIDVYCCPEGASICPLLSNGYPIERMCHGNILTELLPSNGHMRHNIYNLPIYVICLFVYLFACLFMSYIIGQSFCLSIYRLSSICLSTYVRISLFVCLCRSFYFCL